MKRLGISFLFIVLFLSAACQPEGLRQSIKTDAGNTETGSIPVVNTPNGNAPSGNTDAAGSGKADAGSTDKTNTNAGSTDAADASVAKTDAASVDGRNPDVGNACAQAPVVLGAAGNFVVLAGSTVTSTGLSSVTGDLGVSPGTAVTGFGPGVLVGVLHAGDPVALLAEASLTTAYRDAAGRALCPVTVAGNLGGQTLPPGLYKSTSSLGISSGDLVLDARGDSNAVFIFQMASTLTTTSGRQVMLIGGAKAANVFWQVGTSATLGSTSVLQGTVMADQAITLNTGARLTGRALARIAAVTLDSNVIVRPTP